MTMLNTNRLFSNTNFSYDYRSIIAQIEEQNRAYKAVKEHKKLCIEQEIENWLQSEYNRLSLIFPTSISTEIQHFQFTLDNIENDLQNFCNSIRQINTWSFESVFMITMNFINAATRGGLIIQVCKNWREMVNLYGIAIANPGCMKRVLSDALMSVFSTFQNDLKKNYENVKQENKYKENFLKYLKNKHAEGIAKSLRNHIRDVHGNIDIEHIKQELSDYTEAHCVIEKELLDTTACSPSILAEQFTDVMIKKLMFYNGGGQAILTTENETFVKRILNGKIDNTVYTKAYDGEYISYNSTINNPEITCPFLSILAFSQPTYAMKFFNSKDLIASGLSERFVPIIVEIDLSDMIYGNYEDAAEKMRSILSWILSDSYNRSLKNEKIVLELSTEAQDVFEDFKWWIEAQKLYNNIDGLIQSLYKLAGLALRYAGTYHAYISRKSNSRIITGKTMKIGIECAKCAHMYRNYIYNPNMLQAKMDAIAIVDWIFKGHYQRLRSDGIYQNSPVRDRDRVCRAMDLLAANNYIAQYVPSYGVRHCVVNPNLWNPQQLPLTN